MESGNTDTNAFHMDDSKYRAAMSNATKDAIQSNTAISEIRYDLKNDNDMRKNIKIKNKKW